MKPYILITPLVTIAVAIGGSLLTSSGMRWYNSINLPSFTPPGAIIGTVWTVIFILAAVSALMVFGRISHGQLWTWLTIVFLINGLLNVLWSFLFFNQHLIGPAVIEAGLLGVSVLILIFMTWPISKLASGLLMPYAAWVIFATYLTYSVWALNS